MPAPLPRPVPLGLAPSFGFGDRTGLATPGHVAAMKKAGKGIQPIFPQQSIREMMRTQRSAQQVMDEALRGMVDSGWTGITGADADHLKIPADVDVTAAAGFVFFTIDPSDDVDGKADNYTEAELRAKFAEVQGQISWFDQYKGKSIKLSTGTTIELSEQASLRCAVKYGRAINRAVKLADYIAKVMSGKGYEIELSVDETAQPTTLAEHYIIAEQCLKKGMKLVSLAPRFLGDFEKGVDYKGDLKAFEKSLADHAAIAKQLGPYKISLHSGSDKLSIYTLLARLTGGMCHVKTAGTSYLEALRVVARHNQDLFKRLIAFARGRYDTDKATYHVSATLAAVKDGANMSIPQAEETYLQTWPTVKGNAGFTEPGRQILHCTFGSTLTDAELGAELRQTLVEHPDTYKEVLELHFAKHLESLNKGM